MSRILPKRLLLLAMTLVGACAPSRSPGEPPSDAEIGPSDSQAGPDGGAVAACGDERSPDPSPPAPIVNGTDHWDPAIVALTDGQALSIGAMNLRRLDGTWVGGSCTATLLTSKVAVTAAHCLLDRRSGRSGDMPPEDLRFVIGEDAAAPLATFEIESVHRHPDYTRAWGSTAHHDIGVMVLKEHATVAVPGVELIPFNCSPLSADGFVGERVQNVGYGDISPLGTPMNTRRFWTTEEVIELQGFAFLVDGAGVSSVCSGDSGGPSLWTMSDGVVRVVGSVSWGDFSCVDVDRFTRTDDNCDFLESFGASCGEVTEAGSCDGAVATYCEEGSVVARDCAGEGLACGDAGGGVMRCVAPDDPCAGETLEGRCDGALAVYCDASIVERDDCAARGLACGIDGEGRARCVDPPDACGGITRRGICEGDDAVWCEAGRLRTRRCGVCGARCGWSEQWAGSYCI